MVRYQNIQQKAASDSSSNEIRRKKQHSKSDSPFLVHIVVPKHEYEQISLLKP